MRRFNPTDTISDVINYTGSLSYTPDKYILVSLLYDRVHASTT